MEYNKQNGVISRIIYCDTKEKVLLRHTLSEKDGVPASIADFINAHEQKGVGFIGSVTTGIRRMKHNKNHRY